MESLALPLSFLVLVWVFGGMVAAALPVAVGGFAILGAMASLRAVSLFANVSIFALNLTVAMGTALAIDYTLLILSRFRDELAEGQTRDAALIRTMATAGRTVLFSAMTVALSMATMVLFPQYFLKSFAYAGVAVVAFAVAAAIVVTPAAIVLLGEPARFAGRAPVDAPHPRGGPQPRPAPVERWFWYRWTKFVMRHAVPIVSPSSRSCCCSARPSAMCGGASPTTGCCPPRPRRARSATSCATTFRAAGSPMSPSCSRTRPD